jgi:peptidoglycan/LPS O-acetylase OafA/YrhL
VSGEGALAVETPQATRAPGRPASGYIPVLDGLRAVSIGLVILGHVLFRDQADLPPPLGALGEQFAWFGVNVFFVISGYLITLLLLREERRYGSISLKDFYARRALRIFPAFYTYLAVVTALVAARVVVDVPPHDLVASALYIRNIFGRAAETRHLWSLSLEEQFYWIWPGVLVLVAARRRLGVLAWAIAGFTAWRAFLIATGRTDFGKLYTRPDQRMDTILVGCGLALLVGGVRFERISRAVLERGWFAAATLAALVVWLGWGRAIPYADAVWQTTTAALTALLAHWLMRNADAPGARLLQVPAMLFIGRLSYSLYLWQQMFLCEPTPRLEAIRSFPLDLLLTAAFALASYFWVERPLLALKDRRFKRPAGAGPAPGDAARP